MTVTVKALLTDLETRRVYQGVFRNDITQGKNVILDLDGPNKGYAFTVTKVRGWLSDVNNDYLFYLFDGHGKRFKVRIKEQVIDAKL